MPELEIRPQRRLFPILLTAVLPTAILLVGAAAAPLLAQEVRLPLDRYDALRSRAFPEPPPALEPPVPVAFEAARLDIDVSAASARVIQELTLSIHADGWHRVELPAAGSFVAADWGVVDGYLEGGDGWTLHLRGRGSHQVRLESAVAVEADEEATRQTLRTVVTLPRAAAVRGLLRVPAWVEEVAAGEGVLLDRGEEEAGWRFLAPPGSRLELTLLGAATVPLRSRLPLRFEATVATVLEIGRTRTDARAWIAAEVRQGRLENLAVRLPPGLEVVRVETEPAAEWEVSAGRLEVAPGTSEEERLTVRVELTGPPAEEVASPAPVVEGAVISRVFAKVHPAGDGLLSLLDPGSAVAVGEADRQRFPTPFAAARGVALEVGGAGSPPRWQVLWPAGAEVLAAQVRRLRLDLLAGEDGRSFAQLWLEAESSGSRHLTLTPPAGFELAAAAREGAPFVPGSDGGSLVFPLSSGVGRQLFYLAGFLPLELPRSKGPVEIALPELSAPVQRVEVRLVLPPGWSWKLRDETRSGTVGEVPGTFSAPRSSRAPGALAARLGLEGGAADGFGNAAEIPVPAPPAFHVLTARWDALSPRPGSLILLADPEPPRKEWF